MTSELKRALSFVFMMICVPAFCAAAVVGVAFYAVDVTAVVLQSLANFGVLR